MRLVDRLEPPDMWERAQAMSATDVTLVRNAPQVGARRRAVLAFTALAVAGAGFAGILTWLRLGGTQSPDPIAGQGPIVRRATPEGEAAARLILNTTHIASGEQVRARLENVGEVELRLGRYFEVERLESEIWAPVPWPERLFFTQEAFFLAPGRRGSILWNWPPEQIVPEPGRYRMVVVAASEQSEGPDLDLTVRAEFVVQDESGPAESGTVSSAVDLGDGLRCTVTAPAEVQPGDPIGVRFTYENNGIEPVEIDSNDAVAYGGETSFRVQGIDGRKYDLVEEFRKQFISGGGFRRPIALQPGEVHASEPSGLLVRWGGPLTVVPRCSGRPLDPLTIRVAEPGATPSAADALSRSAAAAGIFSDCMPPADGGSVMGTIAPPDGADFEALEARCWAEARSYPGFTTVTFAVVSPSSAPAAPLTEYWPDLRLPDAAPAVAFQWAFVVTESEVLSVDGPAYSAATPPKLVEVEYGWNEGAWEHHDPGRQCGGAYSRGSGIVFFTAAYEPCG